MRPPSLSADSTAMKRLKLTEDTIFSSPEEPKILPVLRLGHTHPRRTQLISRATGGAIDIAADRGAGLARVGRGVEALIGAAGLIGAATQQARGDVAHDGVLEAASGVVDADAVGAFLAIGAAAGAVDIGAGRQTLVARVHGQGRFGHALVLAACLIGSAAEEPRPRVAHHRVGGEARVLGNAFPRRAFFRFAAAARFVRFRYVAERLAAIAG